MDKMNKVTGLMIVYLIRKKYLPSINVGCPDKTPDNENIFLLPGLFLLFPYHPFIFSFISILNCSISVSSNRQLQVSFFVLFFINRSKKIAFILYARHSLQMAKWMAKRVLSVTDRGTWMRFSIKYVACLHDNVNICINSLSIWPYNLNQWISIHFLNWRRLRCNNFQ